MNGQKFYATQLKPFVDRVLASVLLISLIPLMLLIGILVLLKFRKNPFFTQKRVGFEGKIFELFKFRSMKVDGESNSMGRLGSWLRKSAFDELPQLLNIIRGDMSFVGPRPLLPEYLSYYSEEERKRHAVLPGITGLAQVSGRAALPWGQRLLLDVSYVNTQSLALDLKIILKTVHFMLSKAPDRQDAGSFIDYAKNR